MTSIRVDNLTIATQKRQEILIDNISFELPAGSVTGLVGESGSGKSLTATSLMQLLPNALRNTGSINIEGPDKQTLQLMSLSGRELRNYRGQTAGMIFQDPMQSLNPSIKAGEQVLEAIILHQKLKKKTARKHVIQMFEQVKIQNPERIYRSYPFQLSGGQRQRVMIAMALINNPSLLIADEATTALDVTVQSEIIKLIKNLQQTFNLTVLFITHDLALLHSFADYVLIMQNGKIVEQGNFKMVTKKPKSAYTQGLLACRPNPEHTHYLLPEIENFSGVKPYEPEQKPQNIISDNIALLAKNINVYYAQKRQQPFHALNNIDIQIKNGETLGIVGESGCGKTTLSKALLQMIPYTGQIYINNQPVACRTRKEKLRFRKKIQFVFQDPYASLNPSHKIGAALKEVLKVHGKQKHKQRINELLVQVGLPEKFAARYPHELSGGQRQRVAIARALATEPEILILDEAVAALDVSVQAKVLNLLNRLKANLHLTYIFISHDLDVVQYMADNIMVMHDGKIVEEGSAKKVFFHPESDYTKKLIKASPKNYTQ